MNQPRNELISRELSWLDFNQRVLNEATDSTVPLLERINFLAITASNLDEFFMVRVAGLHLMVDGGITSPDESGRSPADQLSDVLQRVIQMASDQYKACATLMDALLKQAGIAITSTSAITPGQSRHSGAIFDQTVFPVVTPTVVDGEFPAISGLRLHVAVRLEGDTPGTTRLAIVPAGPGIDRCIPLPTSLKYECILLEDLLCRNAGKLFPGKKIVESVPFRITRNADLAAEEFYAPDFMTEMEDVLTRRKQSQCVRLEILNSASTELLELLKSGLQISDRDIFAVPGPLDLSFLRTIAGLDGFNAFKYEPWSPQPSPDDDPRASMFDLIRKKDILLFHPYESFEPVLRFIRDAARDPDVLAIKQILYRTSADSPLISYLCEAAEKGKYVTVLMELKARFDEARNIEWARRLERAGAQVIYGVKGLKTHAKLCIVVRREPTGIQRYVHTGTGNYNDRTARIYSDAGLMTCNPDIGADASALFNAICGYSEPVAFLKLTAAPAGLRDRIIGLIASEAERSRQGQKALIMAKMNSLVDRKIISALYSASQAGVKIQLNVRGVCCLRPGVKGLSDNISVVSIIDRFLEHARIFYFYGGGTEPVFISSADWMPRNMDKRIELMTPVDDPSCRRRLMGILQTCFKDNVKSYRLQQDGTWEQHSTAGRKKSVRAQEIFYRIAWNATRDSEKARRTVFEPHMSQSADQV